MRVIDVGEQSKFDWFNLLYFHYEWITFDKLSCEINSRNAPWIKNSKNLALLVHIFRCTVQKLD